MDTDSNYDFDYLVIGGGSGGIASGKRAAMHGAKVAGKNIRLYFQDTNSNYINQTTFSKSLKKVESEVLV